VDSDLERLPDVSDQVIVEDVPRRPKLASKLRHAKRKVARQERAKQRRIKSAR
jgi:hypothetical protein